MNDDKPITQPEAEQVTDEFLQTLQDRMTRDFADMMAALSVKASITVTAGPPVTYDQLLAEVDAIDRNRPIVFCTPEHETQIRASVEQVGLNVKVVGVPECPVGKVMLHIPPGFRPGDPPLGEYGYAVDHSPEAARCCESHNTNCEPSGDLCCDDCPEVDHYRGLTHTPCVLDRCTCTSEQQHLDTTQPGYAGARIGMREPR